MYNRDYDPVMCMASGKGFKRGTVYAAVGCNNGIHVFRTDDNGNPVEFIAHCVGYSIEDPEGSGKPSFELL